MYIYIYIKNRRTYFHFHKKKKNIKYNLQFSVFDMSNRIR